MKFFNSFALSLVVGLFGCKAATIAKPIYSCNLASAGQCLDLDANYPSTTATTLCSTLSGTLSTTSACTATGRVGHCSTTSQGYTNTYSYYSTGTVPFTADTAAAACTAQSGTFTPSSVGEAEEAQEF